jgi:hypothetical protein
MNERIRLLAEQAGYKHPDAVGKCEDYAYFDHEKFAELIIRKCAKVADLADENKCEWIGGNILNHFGVEE